MLNKKLIKGENKMSNELIEALISQGRTREGAELEYQELRTIFYDYLNEGDTIGAYEVLSSVGLEPDYLMDLI